MYDRLSDKREKIIPKKKSMQQFEKKNPSALQMLWSFIICETSVSVILAQNFASDSPPPPLARSARESQMEGGKRENDIENPGGLAGSTAGSDKEED